MSIKTRQASRYDLDAILLLFKETIETVNARDYSFEQIRVWSNGAYKKDSWLRKIEEHFFIVAELDDDIAGFGSITKEGLLDFLYVSKNHQRIGVATTIYAQIESYARKHHLQKISSDASVTAKPFFEKQGFEVIQQQQVIIEGVELMNYNMAKHLFEK